MDSSFLKADIFFAITTAAIIIITGLAVAGLVYVISILRVIKKISNSAKEGAETVVAGIHEAKNNLQEDGLILSLLNIFKKAARQKTNHKSNKKS